jgi:hypothetical protein
MTNSSLLKMIMSSGFTHWKWWFSIVMSVYHRVTNNCGKANVINDVSSQPLDPSAVIKQKYIHTVRWFNIATGTATFPGSVELAEIFFWMYELNLSFHVPHMYLHFHDADHWFCTNAFFKNISECVYRDVLCIHSNYIYSINFWTWHSYSIWYTMHDSLNIHIFYM